MTRITGLLAWYDESPLWLAGAVTAAARLCDHIVAVDGAYALYPGGRPQSDPEQAEAILHAAYGAGVGVTVYRPDGVWTGNQVEKRSVMFELGRATRGEWFFVFDADDLVTHVPFDLHDRLEAATEDVGCFTLWWTEDMHRTEGLERVAQEKAYPHEAANRYHRGLFRSLPGLRVEGAHYHYVAERPATWEDEYEFENGLPVTVHLRGHQDYHQLEPFVDLKDLRVQHRHPQRTRERLDVSAAYDRIVRAHGLEKTTAEQWAATAA